MNHAFVAAMTETGQTPESLAAQLAVDPKTVARWANPGHIPQSRHRAKVAQALGREVADLWPDVQKRREPVWFRPWTEHERDALTLRWFELAWVPGLLQTEAYARATLAGEALTGEEVDRLVSARIGRQAVLRRERSPLLTAVMDEGVLHRTAGGNRAMMREQCDYLAECAELPSVQILVVPSSVGMYAGLGGAFILADLPDGSRMAHVDGQASAQIIDAKAEIATLDRRWSRITGDALPRALSLELIRKAAEAWT
ncbi:Scr1 family TA system antitoxin-like transcriptional regulator [Micromonospora sediminicola]|uniref:Scr1 family TA system antitoxin-like transcriptional regulator n=1 Tax=Micromonospora sediminicola TaxID=946078 RepID=UPI0037990076